MSTSCTETGGQCCGGGAATTTLEPAAPTQVSTQESHGCCGGHDAD